VLALLASLQCMLWLSIAADELVSLFQSIGRICDFSQDLLGATVLAWGEAVPELVATMTLARQGHATTAVSAVFGGARGWAGGAAAASVPAAACCASAALCVPAAAWQLCWHGSR
jgi:Ca2+/H+ antiporter